MIRPVAALALALLAAGSATAETLVAARTISSRAILTADDLAIVERTVPGALRNPVDAIGLEARVVLYPGRPIRAADLVSPATIERNQIVILVFRSAGLTIATEGRSLDRAAVGDRIRAMNLSSRATVSGTVSADGSVRVGPSDALLAHMEGQ